jgi:hypothetical protein
MPKTQAVTIDIDSTLADTRHRAATMIDPAERESTDWTAYARACGGDSPTDVIALVRALAPHYTIVLVTSRPVASRNETLAWLDAQQVPYDALVMDEGFHTTPTEFKVAAIEQVNYTYDVVLHLDDWWGIGEAVRETLGIPTVIVRVYAPQSVEMAF